MPTNNKSVSPSKASNAPAAEKAKKVQTQSRLLWSKHDTDLDNLIQTEAKIKLFLAASFKNAKLEKDFKNVDDKVLDQHIKDEVKADV